MDGGGDIVESYGHNKNNGKILYAYEIEFLTFQPAWVKLGEGAKRSKFLINQNYQTRQHTQHIMGGNKNKQQEETFQLSKVSDTCSEPT